MNRDTAVTIWREVCGSGSDTDTVTALEAFASKIEAAERERAARACDAEARVRLEAGLQHPEDSMSRSRCFAAARSAQRCAEAIREGADATS